VLLNSRANGPNKVSTELKKMTAFIRQEALEKARELEIKADEEFAIEKSKLVRQETASIDTLYQRKYKQAEMSQQISRSNVTNKTRLKVLSAKQELLDDLFEKARGKLAAVTKDEGKYQAILKNLILEGSYAMAEDKLKIKARKADYPLVKKAVKDAAAEYKKEIGKDVTFEIDEKDPLPQGS
jgi:V-type H+-transporting ATPase subunit E